MSILLTQAIRVGGAVLAAGSTQTLEQSIEADLVQRKAATYVSAPDSSGLGVPVYGKTNVLTGVIKNYAGDSDPYTATGYINAVDMIGNSIASASAITSDATITYQYGSSIGSNLAAALGRRVRMANTFATAGVNSTYVVDTHLPQFLESSSKFGIFVAFENDVLQLTLAQAISNAETIMRRCRAYGKTAVFVGPLPSLSYTTTAARDFYWGLQNKLISLCEQYGFPYCPGYGLYGDYSNAYPQPLAGYTDASVHPNASTVINKIVKQGLVPIFNVLCPPSGNILVSANTDIYNAIANPDFSGTAGTLGTNASGTIPDNWVGNAYGAGNTGVFSVVASTDANDTAPWFQGVYAGSTASSLTMASSAFSLSGSQFAVGDTIEAAMEMEVVAGGTGLANLDVWIFFTGASKYVYCNVESVNNLAENPGRLTITSPRVQIPAGTTSMNMFGRFRGTGTFNFTGKVRHPSIRKIL